MADISKITLPDGSNTFDIVSKRTRGLYRGQVDSTSTSTAFTAQINGITELYDGLVVLLNNPAVTGENGMTININGLGAKILWSSYQNVATETGFKVDTEWLIYFDATNDRWVRYEGTYTTTNLYAGPCKAGTNGIKNRALLMPVSNTTWESCTTGSGTGTSKARNTNGFLINGNEIDIRYYSSTSNIASGSNTGRTNTFQCYSADSRYSTNGGGSWSALGRSFYLKGTITSGKFYLHTTWWADALPSTADGFYYVYVGQMYDAYRFTLATNHPIFYYDATNGIQRYYPSYIDAATVSGHTVEKDVPATAEFTDHKYEFGDIYSESGMGWVSKDGTVKIKQIASGLITYYNINVQGWDNKQDLTNNAGYHNSIYRGKSLGTSVTAEQLATIADGTFTDLYVGDYWIMQALPGFSNITYRIAGFDLYYGLTYLPDAATLINQHHVVVIPDNPIGTDKYAMNTTNTTTGGYGASNLRQNIMSTYDTYFENYFGSSHVLSYYRYLTNAVDSTTGKATGVGGFLVKCDLMSEMNIYGTALFSGAYDICAESQFPLFRMMPQYRANSDNVTWLNGVGNTTQFVANSKIGRAMLKNATTTYAIRPYAIII